MATAKVCDRCGLVYNKENGQKTLSITHSDRNGQYLGQEIYDVCDKCVKDFLERFLKNE